MSCVSRHLKTESAMSKKKAKKKETVKQRVSKADERVVVLVKKYPVVAGIMFFAGALVGMLVMWFF